MLIRPQYFLVTPSVYTEATALTLYYWQVFCFPIAKYCLLVHLFNTYFPSEKDRSVADEKGNTLLHMVCACQKLNDTRKRTTMELLIKSKVDVTARNSEGKFAMDYLRKGMTGVPKEMTVLTNKGEANWQSSMSTESVARRREHKKTVESALCQSVE